MLRRTASSACGAARTSCIRGLCVGATKVDGKKPQEEAEKMSLFRAVWPEARAYQAQDDSGEGSNFNWCVWKYPFC